MNLEALVVWLVVILLVAGLVGSWIIVRFAHAEVQRVQDSAEPNAISVHDLFYAFRDRLHKRRDGGIDPNELDEALWILRNGFEASVAFPRFAANAAVYVGLLGTLLGLSVAVGNLSQSMPSQAALFDMGLYLRSSRHALSGFGSAFASALSGVLVTLLLSWTLAKYDRSVQVCLTKLANHALQLYPNASLAARPETPQEFAEQLAGSLGTVNETLSLLLKAVVESNAQQAEVLTKHRELVDASIASFQKVSETAVSEFRARLAEQTTAYQVIRDTIRESADDATRQLTSVADATKVASEEIKEAIAAAQRQREETEASIMGLGEAAELIKDSTDLMVDNLKAAGQLSEVVGDAATQLQALSGQTQAAFLAHEKYLAAQTSDFKDLFGDQIARSDAVTNRLAEAVEGHQKFVELALVELTGASTTLETGRFLITDETQFREVVEKLQRLEQRLDAQGERPQPMPTVDLSPVVFAIREAETRIRQDVVGRPVSHRRRGWKFWEKR